MMDLLRRWLGESMGRESVETERDLVDAQRRDVELLQSRLSRKEQEVAEKRQDRDRERG